MSILERILATKREEVAERKRVAPVSALQALLDNAPPPRPFAMAVQRPPGQPIRLIAELKKASPSKGVFRADFDPAAILQAYERSPASALSILTGAPFFQGSLEFLPLARQLTTKPLLCKDFLIDPYQVYEARVKGADAILLIVAALKPSELCDLLALARELGMEALVEVHTEAELETALAAGATLVGINNRNLTTFVVDLHTTLRLRPLVPKECIIVSESGIETRAQVRLLEEAGVDAILVGETLIKSPDIVAKARELVS